MYESQKLGLYYFAAAIALFGVSVVAGLLSGTYYIQPDLLFNKLDFSIAKILHIDTMIVWLLMGFIGAIYWFLPIELGRETEGIKLARWMFWILCVALLIVTAVFIFVQYGKADQFALWFINQGRKYVEAPRWAAIGIVLVVAVFMYNIIATAVKSGNITGIMAVLMVDLIPLFGLYLFAFPAMTNMSEDLYWWWWLVHMWVEATWEVLMGCIMALALMQLFGTARHIVETWLYIEVALVLGTGILGLGHHYFWIGTPQYWLAIGGFFSALEPLPLLGMVVHAVYDAGKHGMRSANRPALYWTMAEAFGNFLGAGVWGFMMTLPQINLYSHGTQWTVSHGHFAFWGAYGCGVIAVVYIALQKVRALDVVQGHAWKWGFGLLNAGMIGMTGALLVSGIAQAFTERAIGGSTIEAFIQGQSSAWFMQGMYARLGFGVLFAAGYFVLVYDLLTLGRGRESIAQTPQKLSPA